MQKAAPTALGACVTTTALVRDAVGLVALHSRRVDEHCRGLFSCQKTLAADGTTVIVFFLT